MDFFIVIVLALIQGIAAWIPVSSKTQVLLWGTVLFSQPFDVLLSLAVALHVGDVFALAFEYRKEYLRAIKIPSLDELKNFQLLGDEKKEFYFLIIATVFTGLVGLPLYLLTRKYFTELTGSLLVGLIGLLLVGYAVFSFIARRNEEKKALTLSRSVLAGIVQGFAVLPGVSRSGSMQGALILSGIEPGKAVRLSFLAGLPMILLAITAFAFTDGFSGLNFFDVLIGIAVSFVASLATMKTVTRLAEKVKFHYFSLALGIVALLAFAVNYLVKV